MIKPHQYKHIAAGVDRVRAAAFEGLVQNGNRTGTIYTKRGGRALLTVVNKYPNPQKMQTGKLYFEMNIDMRPFNEALKKLTIGLSSLYEPRVSVFNGVVNIDPPY